MPFELCRGLQEVFLGELVECQAGASIQRAAVGKPTEGIAGGLVGQPAERLVGPLLEPSVVLLFELPAGLLGEWLPREKPEGVAGGFGAPGWLLVWPGGQFQRPARLVRGRGEPEQWTAWPGWIDIGCVEEKSDLLFPRVVWK